jgi:hypothetical protein
MAAGNAEAGPLEVAIYMETIALDEVVGLIRQAWTALFLPLDKNTEPSDESYVNEAKGSSSEEGSEDKNKDVEEDEDEDVDEDVEEADKMRLWRCSWGKYSSFSMLVSTHAPCPSFLMPCLFLYFVFFLCVQYIVSVCF